MMSAMYIKLDPSLLSTSVYSYGRGQCCFQIWKFFFHFPGLEFFCSNLMVPFAILHLSSSNLNATRMFVQRVYM